MSHTTLPGVPGIIDGDDVPAADPTRPGRPAPESLRSDAGLSDGERAELIALVDEMLSIEFPRLAGPADAGGPMYYGEVQGKKIAARRIAKIIGYEPGRGNS